MYKKFEIKTTFGYGNRMERTKSRPYYQSEEDEYLDIENKIWKGCAKGESWSDYMKKMEKDIAEWSLPTLKEEMKEELENKKGMNLKG